MLFRDVGVITAMFVISLMFYFVCLFCLFVVGKKKYMGRKRRRVEYNRIHCHEMSVLYVFENKKNLVSLTV
jgi:type IV secretory pathway VirB6-like protein